MLGGPFDWLLRDPRGRAKRLRLRMTVIPPRTRVQKWQAVRGGELAARERELLGRTDSRLHPYEDMYDGDGFQYFRAGLTAVGAIDKVLEAAGAKSPARILDMPCGFGRVMRTLAARFPDASITGCDIRVAAVRFCARRFGAEEVVSSARFEEIEFPGGFDLIWCGSLVTHLPAARTLVLLDLFARSLRPDGLVVFTTHGAGLAPEIAHDPRYALDPADAVTVLEQFERGGYGYADYPTRSSYGVSLISPDWIRSNLEGRSGLVELACIEQGWGSGQDVYAFGLKPLSPPAAPAPR